MRTRFPKISFYLYATLFLAIAGTSARAESRLIPIGPGTVHPAGHGTVNTVLVVQSPGRTTNEWGQVAYNPNSANANSNGDVITGNQVVAGANNQTYSVSQLGITNASDLCINFNINEPNRGGSNLGPNGTVTVNSLVLNGYDQNGNLVFTANLANSITLTEATLNGNGTGTSDYVFGLNSEAAAALQAAINANPNLRLGLSASISNAQGGPESFFFGAGCAPAPVPEPATMILLGTGLAGVAAKVRKRRKAAKK